MRSGIRSCSGRLSMTKVSTWQVSRMIGSETVCGMQPDAVLTIARLQVIAVLCRDLPRSGPPPDPSSGPAEVLPSAPRCRAYRRAAPQRGRFAGDDDDDHEKNCLGDG